MEVECVRYVIIRLSSIGDIVLTTALPRCIKTQINKAHIDFITKQEYIPLLQNNPYIDNVIPYEAAKDYIWSDCNVIDLQNNHKSRALYKHSCPSFFRYRKKNWQKFLFVHFKINLIKKQSVVEKYFDVAKNYGSQYDGKGLEYWLPQEVRLLEPELNTKRMYAIAPGAKHKTKQWLPEHFAKLLALIAENDTEAEFVLLGGQEDAASANAILSDSAISPSLRTKIQNYVGKTNFDDLVRLLDASMVLITNDTGVMHIAAARKRPIVAIFGSTTADFGFAPFGTDYIICETDLKCRPCSHIGSNKCKRKDFACMRNVSPEKVLESVMKIIIKN